MELQALLVLCGLGVAGVAVLLLMSLFSSSGTSYEEAIAQQRKATTELLALAENKNKNNKKNNKKAIKKQAKKEKKETVAVSTNSDHESEAPAESGVEDESVAVAPKSHVEFSPPVVVDITRDAPPNVKPQEKVEEPLEKKEAKPPKQPKAPKAAAPKPAPLVEASKEEPRERRDSVEAPKEQRKVKKVEKKPEKSVEEVVEVIREEVVPPLNVPQPSELTTEKLLKQALINPPAPAAATATPPGGKKKKKPEPNVLTLMAGDSGGVNVSELVRVVQEAALSRTDIQILTDTLLNKHHDPLPEHSEWIEGPNDPMQKMKKQLADKEKALADEVEASQALHAKLKELRGSLNAARAQVAALSRSGSAELAAARAEIHTLQTRLTTLHDENQALAQEKILLQQKLGAEAEAQEQRVQMEIQIQRLLNTEAALMAQIAALQLECGGLAMDAGAASETAAMAQRHAGDMVQQLQEASRAYGELEQKRQMAEQAEQRALQELRAAQERLAGMAELQNEVQRQSSRAQAAEINAEKIKEEAEKQKQQLTSEIASLGEQLAAREAELAEVKQLKAVPTQNGLPAASEQLKAAEMSAVEGVVTALREELLEAQRGSKDQHEQLARLREQLHAYQDKNNELRTKNWKVMEALQSAEKALQTKASALPAQDLSEAIAKAQEAQYNEVATVLRTVFPSGAPSDSTGHDWLQTFAENLKKELQKREAEKQELEKKVAEKEKRVAEEQELRKKAAEKLELQKREAEEREKRAAEQVVEKIVTPAFEAPLPDKRLAELQSQNEHLQGLVDKYKRVIDDTEGVLSRLQQNVTTEEQRWARQLADKQKELDELRQRTLHQMQSKIDALESQLAQAKATNHNHSFADAERLTEERLMGGLSEKLSLDVCNGPSQVGLEDK